MRTSPCRRAALLVAVLTIVLALAGCGGGSDKASDDAGPKKDASGLIFMPSDSTAQATASA